MERGLSFGTTQARWVLAATVLGSGIAFLDGTVVNVALPPIREDLGGGLAGLQWVLDGYLVTLGALILLGGSLGDLYGRRKMFVWGVGGFAVASALCGFAPNIGTLIAARALQGVAAALLVPGSLAIIQAVFAPADRSRAIGAWSGLAGVTTAIGPFVGGYMVDSISWRLVFFINLPLAALTIWIALKHVPETRNEDAVRHIDLPGATAVTVALAGILFALIEGPVRGWTDGLIVATAAIGTFALVAFFVVEARSVQPMMPLRLFKSRQFSGANAMTLVVYGALSGALFLVILELQTIMGYSALEAGASLMPLTILLLMFSSRAGALAQRVGPRIPMTLGPLIVALGFVAFTRVAPGESYLATVFPAAVIFGLGMCLVVAPLTAAVLAAADDHHAGIASGINNAVARIAGLLAIALFPLASSMSGTSGDAVEFTAAFHRAMWIAAAMCVIGGAISFASIRTLAAPTEEEELLSTSS
jgi:EmrB/QacA subfamily drug resistance transporter